MDIKLKDNSKLRLGYAQLEYIKNTGTQYIDSGILTSTNLIIEFEASDFVNNKATMVVGARVANGNSSVMFQTGANINLGACIQYKSSEWSNNIIPLSEMVSSVKIKYTVVCDNNNMKVYKNDAYVTQITNTSTNFTPFSLAIFGLNTNGTIRPTEGNCKLYSLKIKQNNIVVRNFIPVKDHDNEVCLYDTVSETLFHNQGTGNFIAGPEVPCTIISLQNNILLKTTTLYHKNTPNTNGLQLLNSILDAQKTAEDVVLNRIRVDIGNVSGSLSELLQYAQFAGFNDAGEEQAKPRLVGTWTINDWYTQEQLAQAQAAFDGLTIVGDSNYLLDFSQMAVQTLDDTQPNYNPAVAIILQRKNLGITMDNPVVAGQTGRWFLLKSNGLTYPSNTFNDVTNSVTDANGIVSKNTALTYQLKSFHEFQYFKGITCFDAKSGFQNCRLLKSFTTSGNLSVYKNMTITNAHGNMVLYLKETNPDIAFDAPAYTDRRTFVDESGGNLTDRYIFCAYRDRYKDFLAKEIFINRRSNYKTNVQRFRTYYEYCAPQIYYQDGLVTITVERQSDIYYTLDGSVPITHSNKYTEPFTWDGTGVIKAMAIDTTNVIGDIAYADNFYATDVELPVISYNTTTKQISITCNTPNSTIYYTLDGTHPSFESSIYSSPIDATELGDIVNVRCFAVKNGMNDSEVVGKICVMDDTLWGTDSATSSFAVQCMDSTKPNYNPAVCIILDNNSKLTNECYNGGGYITKEDAAAITNFGTNRPYWFSNKVNVLDKRKLIDGTSFEFTSFNELKYFTSKTVLLDGYNANNVGEFGGCTKLQSISLKNITNIKAYAFYNCPSLTNIAFEPNQITNIGDGAFANCTLLPSINIQDTLITTTNGGVFTRCTSLTTLVYPSTLTTISSTAFYNGPSIFFDFSRCTITSISNNAFFNNYGSIRFSQQTVPTISNPSSTWYRERISKIYIGDGNSQSDDETMLALFANNAGFAPVVSKLDTWYNYLHPTT